MKNANSKAKKSRIKNSIVQAIQNIYIANPDLTAKEIRQQVSKLQKDNPAKYEGRLPSLRTVQLILKRPKNVKNSPEFQNTEQPWSLDKTPDLSADAIAAIFEVQRWLENAKEDPMLSTIPGWTNSITSGKMTTTIWPLTVREALWVSKLYKVKYNLPSSEQLYLKVREQPVVSHRTLIENPYSLWYAAKSYADYQRLCELTTGPDFDTSRLDEAIRTGSIGKIKYDLFSNQQNEVQNEGTHSKTGKE